MKNANGKVKLIHNTQEYNESEVNNSQEITDLAL